MKKINKLTIWFSFKTYFVFLFGLIFIIAIPSCKKKKPSQNTEVIQNDVSVSQAKWLKNTSIYEVNLRQYSSKGGFSAVMDDLDRLVEMGITCIWLMPIHPIGEEKRKGTLGSYYSVKDYMEVNPEFGTKEEFRMLVNKVHEKGMYIIIDWVPNHTAWDHVWTESNPEWYLYDENGDFALPNPDWTDVIQLDYSNEDMRQAMLNAMLYWVREYDIDGYRNDYLSSPDMPKSFFAEAKQYLEQIKPVLMLAEAEGEDYFDYGFDMTYAWEYHHTLTAIARGEKTLADVVDYFDRTKKTYPKGSIRLYFTSNHDENSWQGSDIEMFGDNFLLYAVMSATIDGAPLIYSGQESGLDKRLAFFEKDVIEWGNYKYMDFYQHLLKLKTENKALWQGAIEGKLTFHSYPNQDEDVMLYSRQYEDDEVLVILNFDTQAHTIDIDHLDDEVSYLNLFTSETFTTDMPLQLSAHDYRVFVRKN